MFIHLLYLRLMDVLFLVTPLFGQICLLCELYSCATSPHEEFMFRKKVQYQCGTWCHVDIVERKEAALVRSCLFVKAPCGVVSR